MLMIVMGRGDVAMSLWCWWWCWWWCCVFSLRGVIRSDEVTSLATSLDPGRAGGASRQTRSGGCGCGRNRLR
ncbi:hypothetical protein BZA05DRAFT_388171 [Tricharina praecox]|uniref:uncharacterized protein n=1 Tax=Tricharina praecox TaxID=43433 RepID=UPI00221F9910|nr:uncharacterized protein BZA05DRAFT_388171 [Tricharina praecox]KAI5856336.1 hypothetical protein BZA05DRAFT_388171 [Tricharina praecox]